MRQMNGRERLRQEGRDERWLLGCLVLTGSVALTACGGSVIDQDGSPPSTVAARTPDTCEALPAIYRPPAVDDGTQYAVPGRVRCATPVRDIATGEVVDRLLPADRFAAICLVSPNQLRVFTGQLNGDVALGPTVSEYFHTDRGVQLCD